jgi:membrane-bound lytic murein transglycosylase D
MIKARAGDTLSRLASRHGVSAANVADWNRLKPNAALTNGQTLAIYVPAKASRASGKSSPKRASVQKGKAPVKAAARGAKPASKR